MKASIRILFLAFLFLPLSLVQAQDNNEQTGAEQAAETVEAVSEQEAAADPVPPEAESTDAQQTETTAEDDTGEEAVEEESDAESEGESEAGMDAESQAEAEAESAESESEPEAGIDAEFQAEAEAEPSAEASEAFVLQGHPVFTPEQARLVYQPLVDYLNDATPYRFELMIARDFHRYWLDIRRGVTPDLTLEEAHMTAYRMEHNDYTPLVKAEEPMTYSLLSSSDGPDATLQDLVSRPVSSMPAPSLGYLVLSRWYENPMQQPLIHSDASSWRDAIEIVFSMEADAAMAPNTLVERYVNLQPIETSREFPGITISAAPSIPEEVQQEIREALLALHEDEDHYEALHELDIDRFVEATGAEYEGLDELLSEIITAR